jgi:phospholipid/cholesterol/gamma-HCH transport system substrate-binding protein
MMSRLVRVQLTLFALITVAALFITAAFYVKIPQQLGIGRYESKVELADTGGLYAKANVTYRGTEVGLVRDIRIDRGGGVVATLSIDNGVKIPKASIAEVRSVSVVGEQYIDFVPPPKTTGGPYLRAGGTVTSDMTRLPTSTAEVLISVNRLIESVPLDDLRTVIDETDKAFRGAGDDISAIINAAGNIEDEATENLPQTRALIEDSNGVLATHQDLDPSIRSFAGSLESLSTQLEATDQDLRSLFRAGPAFFDQTSKSLDTLQEPLNRVLADTATVGNVLFAYTPAVEHILTVYQALEPAFSGSVPIASRDDELARLRLFFKLGLDPPTCEVGYPEAGQFRSPSDERYKAVSQTTYCKAPKESALASRGVRNSPCPNDSGPAATLARGAVASDCGLTFPRVGVPSDLRRSDNNVLLDPGSGSGLAIETYGTPVEDTTTWKQFMQGLVKK